MEGKSKAQRQGILRYLEEMYHPHTIILYGSWCDGTNGPGSDFDALLIADGIEESHDASEVEGVVLDVFCYPTGALEQKNPGELLQLYHGTAVRDERGIAAGLIDRVQAYMEEQRIHAPEEKRFQRDWCRKMLNRSRRGDPEGLYRRHWLLTESLELYCVLRDIFYFGSKKTLLMLERDDPEGYELVCAALRECSQAAMEQWMNYVTEEQEPDYDKT